MDLSERPCAGDTCMGSGCAPNSVLFTGGREWRMKREKPVGGRPGLDLDAAPAAVAVGYTFFFFGLSG